MPVPNNTTLTWAGRIIDALNAPRTAVNMKMMAGWIVGEHGWTWNGSGNNPLNTVKTMPGSTAINNLGGGIGVQSFPTVAEGVTATIDVLHQTNPSYGTLVQGLANSDMNLFFSPQGTKELEAWGGSATYPGYIKSVVDSVSAIPSQYLTAHAATGGNTAASVLESFYQDLNKGTTDLAHLLGVNQFIKPGATTANMIFGAFVAAVILALITEGADNA